MSRARLRGLVLVILARWDARNVLGTCRLVHDVAAAASTSRAAGEGSLQPVQEAYSLSRSETHGLLFIGMTVREDK